MYTNIYNPSLRRDSLTLDKAQKGSRIGVVPSKETVVQHAAPGVP